MGWSWLRLLRLPAVGPKNARAWNVKVSPISEDVNVPGGVANVILTDEFAATSMGTDCIMKG